MEKVHYVKWKWRGKKGKIESNTDKDSGMFFKNEKEKCFAYLAHTACDNNNFILDFHITSGNIHDSVAFPIYIKR